MIMSNYMPILEQGFRIVDDMRTFPTQELTEIWEWLDAFDAAPASARDQARLERADVTFSMEQHVFNGRIYSVASCSDGRQLLGSILGLLPNPDLLPEQPRHNQCRCV